MKSTDILSYTKRLILGEDPVELFNEVEIFYVIRDSLNRLDPGKCRHSMDEYDDEAQYLLNYIINSHSLNKIITSNELADFIKEYFFKQFRTIQNENMMHFSYLLFQEILILGNPRKIRGRKISDILKLSEWEH